MKTNYAIVGLGHRSQMYSTAILSRFFEQAALVALCDSNQSRMDYYNKRFADTYGAVAVPTFKPNRFNEMLQTRGVHTVIVTSMDSTHHQYVVDALLGGCDVVCEKPLTIDAQKCQQIIDVQKQTGKRVTVTFNYRYAPHSSLVKDLLMRGAIGTVTSIHFEWLLDTRHGADYFRRWHRDKSKNGGLMVHKSSHHFDLVNWWLASEPATVFGFGKLAFYGKENALRRGQTNTYARAYGSQAAAADPFALHLEQNLNLKELYLDAEHEDGYYRDQGVFAEGITTEDDCALVVKYANGATLSYHLHAYSPWEGLRVMFNGTKGRMELEWVESAFNHDVNNPSPEADLVATLGLTNTVVIDRDTSPKITLQPLWGKPLRVTIPEFDSGGHGGGDARLLTDIFAPSVAHDQLGRAAGLRDGVMSILTGIAANQSFSCGQPIDAAKLVTW